MKEVPFVAVIMAGGQGQRFWPLSTAAKPKQFLDLSHSGRTLLQATYDRVLPISGSPTRVLVATAERYADLVREQLPDLPTENLLVEPTPRDSAPAIALACLTIEERYGEVVAGFFASDHEIGDGIGSGYRVERFVEKPNVRTAEAYLAGGRHLWNAGIFVWRVSAALEELDRYAANLMGPLRRAFASGELATHFPDLEKISIDFALMERTDRALVVPGNFDWDDVGDWVALERLLTPEDGPGGANTVVGRHVGLDTSRNIVYTDDPDDVIVTFGVHDLVIVKRGNAVMLVHKDRVQEIKSLLSDERMVELLGKI